MSDPTPSPAPAIAPASVLSTAALLKDFPDRLSPIVVKELRQGLRQHGFTLLFIFLQAIMGIVVFGSLLGATPGEPDGIRAGATITGFFFSLFGIAALGVQPLRGLNALAGEIKPGTIDLLLLTRMDSWRITSGKWLALFSQTCLLLVAILPYLIMRYYLGGMQLFNELLGLFTVLVISGALTAMAVGFSATTSVVLRGLFALALVSFLLTFAGSGLVRLVMGRSLGGPLSLDPSQSGFLLGYAGFLIVVAFIGYYFLEMGATQIAPPSENRSTRKRLLGLIVVSLTLWALPWDLEPKFALGAMLCALLIIDAITEGPDFTISVWKPFHRLGAFGRPFGVFLLPGWQHGTLFTGLLLAFFFGSALYQFDAGGLPRSEQSAIGFVAMSFTSLLTPALGIALFRKAERNTFPLYCVVLVGSFIVALLMTILANALNAEDAVAWLFFLFAPLGIIGIDELGQSTGLMVAAIGVMVGWWCLLLIAALPWLRRSMTKRHESTVENHEAA